MMSQDPATPDTIADTLDLAERADLALNGLCRTVDPEDNYSMYFEVRLNARPPYLLHSGSDIECGPKFLEAMSQMRVMCGSEDFRDVEEGMLAAITSYICPDDGLYYALHNPKRPWRMRSYVRHGYEPDEKEDYGLPNPSGIVMTALMHRNELRGDGRWDDTIRGLARGIEGICIQRGDYAYYPDAGVAHPFTRPRGGWPNTDEPQGEHEGGEGSVVASFGYPIRALSMWAARSGDERALELAGKLTRFVMKRKFWGGFSDPDLVAGPELGHVDSHFHARALALRGLLEYAIVSGDTHVGDFVRSSYEYMRSFGIPELGFIPCFTGFQGTGGGVVGIGRYMEGCLLGDLLAMTTRLSQAGFGDYWEDADRITRNHLVEGQLTDRKVLERIVAHSLERPPGSTYQFGPHDNNRQPVEQFPGREHAGEDVIDRVMGIYWAYLGTASTDWARTMQCCTGNATRGLYYAWHSITTCDGDHATVNLLLNRTAPWLDIESFLPYEGRVVLRIRTARRVSVRVPTWARRDDLRWRMNGQDCNPWYAGRYACLDGLKPADTVELQMPVAERTIERTGDAGIQSETVYTLRMRGNTVVDISPRTESPTGYPYYRRDGMKAMKAPRKPARNYTAEVAPTW